MENKISYNDIDEFTREQLLLIYERLDEIMMEYVDTEDYERAAIVRDSKKEISNWALGYGSETATFIAYTICRDEGRPVDAYQDGDDYIITFLFRDNCFQFWIQDFVDFETYKEEIRKHNRKK